MDFEVSYDLDVSALNLNAWLAKSIYAEGYYQMV